MVQIGERVQPKTPEVYSAKPILFREDTTGVIVCFMNEYKAGKGRPPARGHEMALSISAPKVRSFADGVETPFELAPFFEGVYRVIEADEDLLDSPFVPLQLSGYIGVVVEKVRDIEVGDIDNLETAGIYAAT